ncbi:MAG TPA: glycosyltransferase [Methylococcus sp.]|nr:glycosyltransferase [Methylococcus sp.]
MKLRLLFLIREAFPTFRPDVVDLFGRYLPREGVDSDLVAVQVGDAEWGGGRIFAKPFRGKLPRWIVRFCLAFRLFDLARGEYTGIQVRDCILEAGIGLLAARWRRKPFYYWMSFPFPESWLELGTPGTSPGIKTARRFLWRLQGHVAVWLLYRLILPRADHVFVQSEAMREALARRGIARERMTAVPMGVAIPNQVVEVPPHAAQRLAGRRVVIYLGVIYSQRQSEVMLQAMQWVRREVPEALLLVVGDAETPSERAWFEQWIEREGLQDHVWITGWLPREQAWAYLRHAEIGVSAFARTPVFEVASPTKIGEYLAVGIPVVANDQPDQAYLLRETGGGLCVPLTPEGFAGGILALLKDPKRARRMGESGKRRISAIRGYPVIARELAECYRRLTRM